ncbi:hypothetical protein DOY81_006888 [Sarcophaga bullata]|nr:hypothetical protein DOY81_006888 [Sarcophaga bullata]
MQNIDNKSNTLQEFIKQSKDRLNKILERLEWSEDAVKKSFNTNSLASIKAKKTKKLPPVKTSEYPDSCYNQNNVTLETPKLRELLQNNEVEAPRNFKDLQLNFKREEKLKIYEHVIENTKKLDNNLETPVAEGELSLAEIVAQKKCEEKRKKRRFRKSKPTHVEEVRCLVELQMQALKQFLNTTNENEKQRKGYKKECHREHGQDLTDTYRKYSTKYSKELHKRTYSRSRSKELKSDDRRNRSKSPIKERQYERRSHGCKPQNRSPSKEPTYKKRRRSRSKSSDGDSKYNKHKSLNKYSSKRSRSKSRRKYRDGSTYFHNQNPRRSRSKSPYRRDTKQYESPRRKRHSVSKERLSEPKSTRNSSTNCDKHVEKQTFKDYQNSSDKSAYFARRSKSKSPHKREIKQYNHHTESPKRKRHSISKESSYQSRDDLYSRKSAKHKHSKTKKKKHKRDHS